MPNNYDEVVKKNKKYLTNAQINSLAAASKEYGLQNAGSRAGALSSARQQYDTAYRGLQNMGLAGNPNAAPASGEVPRLQTEIQQPFQAFNQRLQDVENQRLSALGSAYKKQTQAARAAAYAARQKQLQQQQQEQQANLASLNTLNSVTRAIQNAGATAYNTAQAQRQSQIDAINARGMAQTAHYQQQVNQGLSQLRAAATLLGVSVDTAYTRAEQKRLEGDVVQASKAEARAPKNLPSLDQKTGDMHTIDQAKEFEQRRHEEVQKATNALTSFRNKNNYGYDAAEDRQALEAANKKVADMEKAMDNGYDLDPKTYQQAKNERDIAQLKVDNPKLYASYVVIEDPSSDMKARQAAADEIMQTYDITKKADTRTTAEYTADKKKEKDVSFWLSVINDKDKPQDEKEAAERGLKSKYGMTVDDAKQFESDQSKTRTDNAEYEYYKDALMNSLTYAGKKPTQPVNDQEEDQLYRAVNKLAKDVDYEDPYLRDDIPLEEIQVGETYVSNRLKYLTEDEVNAYNYIYETEGLQAANKYIKDNAALRNVRAAEADQKYAEKLVDEHPVAGNLMSIAANATGNVPAMLEKLVTGAYNIVSDNVGSGNQLWIDTNDITHSMANFGTNVRNETSRKILESNPGTSGQVYNFIYQGGMSMADSAVAMAFAYCGAPWAVDVMFFSSAGNEAYKDAMDRGATQEQALAYGVLSGAAEAIFEHASVENFLNLDYQGKGRFIRNMLSQAGVEASEEVNTEIANILSDALVMKDKSQYNLEVQDLMKTGMSKDEAEKKALLGQLKNIGMSGLGGFLSGLGFGVFGAVPNAVNQVSTGRDAKRAGLVDEYTQRASLLGGDAARMANEVKETAKPGDRLVGALVQQVNKQMQEQIKGESDEASPEKGAAMQTLMTGDKLTTNGAKQVMDTLGAETVESMGYDTSSPSAFAKSYNARLSEAGIKPKTVGTSAAAASFADSRRAFREYARTPNIVGTNADLEAQRARNEQNRYTAAASDAANRVWANPEQGLAMTMPDGTRVKPMPGNMTAVARAEQERTGFKARTGATKGNVTYAVAGMEARDGLNNEQKYSEIQKGLTKEAREKAKLYEALADALGMKMVIHDVMVGTNGFIDENGVMHVVLSGKQSVLRVAAHELTHFMKDNNRTGYDSLREHLIAEVGQERFDRMLNQKAKEYGLDTSTEKGRQVADDEVCAELCERMLSNEEALEKFAEKDTAAAKTLKDRLLKILNAIKQAFKRTENRNFGDSWSDLIKSQDTIENWVENLQKAITNAETRAAESVETEDERFSLDDDYMRLAESYETGDKDAEYQLTKAVKKAAKDAGYSTPMLFHGTPSFGWTEYKDKKNATPFIYASSKSEVAAHYAGDQNYAFRRDIGKKYNGGTSLDSIIQDARYVRDVVLERPRPSAMREKIAADIKLAQRIADKINDFGGFEQNVPDEVSNAASNMMDVFFIGDTDVLYMKNLNEATSDILYDKATRDEFNENIGWSLRAYERGLPVVRDYLSEHRDELSDHDRKFLQYLLSFEVGDAVADIKYGAALIAENPDRILKYKGSDRFVNADDMREAMDLEHEIGAYKLYGDLGNNPFEFDANGAQWWGLKVPEVSDGYVSTDTVAKWALEHGYTSVIMRNIYDYGDKADNYVFFASNQIKSADPVTYDDNGDVIPLSERFNAQEQDIRYDLDTDAVREAFTTIDTSAIEAGLESLKNVKHVGRFALKDVSRFFDASAGGNRELRDTLRDIFEKPHSEASGRYARGVERMQQRVLDIGQRAGVCDAKGNHFDSKKSAAIQHIGEGFSNTYTDLQLKVKDADHVTVKGYEPDTGKLVVSEKDYTLKELRQAFGSNAADYVWSRVFDETQKAQESGKQAGWVDEHVNTRPYTLADLQTEFKDDWQALERAAREFREMYDEYIRDQNNMLSTIYPIESEFDNEEKIEARIQKKQERLTQHKTAVNEQLKNLQQSLEDKEAEIASKRRTDTKAYRKLVEQAERITAKIAEVQSEIAKYEANTNEDLAKLAVLKAEMQNARQRGDSLSRMHRLQYRSDYFHHFQEMASGVQNLKAIFTNNTDQDISPAIVGKSENTKAKTRWAGYFQERMGGDYTADALGGMLKYGQMAEYKLAFDPFTAYLREATEQIRKIDDSTNRDGLIRYLMAWTDNISGKSHKIDRVVSDSGVAPRKAMQILQWINSRVIQNTLLFNMRSALVQISNVTNAASIVRNPGDWMNGTRCWALASKGDPAMAAIMAQSNFLASRYMDNLQLTDSVLKNAKKFAGWMLGALDEVSCKATWWAAYNQYTRNPNASVIKNMNRSYESAVDYADDVCRRTHAGRGVGELAPAMTSKVVNFVAPFQVEVNNTWQLLKDNVKQKNYLGLLSTGLSVFLFNAAFEAIVGSTPLGFDFIRAVMDIVLGFTDDDDDNDPTVTSIGQRLAGELVGGLPFASQLVSIIGEDTAKKLLGEDNDATRYGNTQIGVSAVLNAGKGLKDIATGVAEGRRVNWIDDLDDLMNLTLPFGAKQLTRSIQGVSTVAKGYAGKYNKEGEEQVQFVTDQNILNYIHAGLFGKWALTDASDYFGEKRLLPELFGRYEGDKSSLGKPVDAKEYKAAIATGIDGREYFSLKSDLKGYTTQTGKRAEMMEHGYSPEQKAQLDALLFKTKDHEVKTEGGVVYQQNSDGDWEVKADYTNQDMFDLSMKGNKTYAGTLEAMDKTGLPQDQAALAAEMWDRAKNADDRKAEFRSILRDNPNLTVEQKEALDRQYVGNKYTADYSDPELYDLSVSNRGLYDKAKEAKSKGIPVKSFTDLNEKREAFSGENRAAYMRTEIMKSNLTAKQKEALDDLLVSDKGENPDYSSQAWFDVSMLGKKAYAEAKKGAEIGLKPEIYLAAYAKSKTINGKDENGNTRRNLKKKRVNEYLDTLNISAPVRSFLYDVVFYDKDIDKA